MPAINPPFKVRLEGGVFTAFFQSSKFCMAKQAHVPYYSFLERPGEIYPSDRCTRIDDGPAIILAVVENAPLEDELSAPLVEKLKEARQIVAQPISSFAHFERRQQLLLDCIDIALVQCAFMISRLAELKNEV